MTVGEKPFALGVSEVFLKAAQAPWGIFSQPKNVLSDLGSLFAETVRFRKEIGIELV